MGMIALCCMTFLGGLVGVWCSVQLNFPRYCVNLAADKIFSKRLACLDSLLPNVTLQELVTSPLKARQKFGSLEYSRMHELFAYYWFVKSETNPYKLNDCATAEMEYIPFLPLHAIASKSKPGDMCSYQQLINDIVNFVEIDQERPIRTELKRFTIASTFNLRSEMAAGLPSQQRRGHVYDKVTQFVTNTYIGHYERFHQCPDVLRKGWKGVIEIPYVPFGQHTRRARRKEQQQMERTSSVLFAGRMWLFGPERVCSVRSAVASLSSSLSPGDQVRERGFEVTVVNLTWSRSTDVGEHYLRAEDRAVDLYGNHTFCLITKGDSYSSSSFYTAIQHLCIPIVVSDWFVFAYNWFVPYDKFVMRISEENFLLDPVKAIGDVIRYVVEDKKCVREMRRQMRMWRRVLRYNVEPWDDPPAKSTRKQLQNALSPAFKPLNISSMLSQRAYMTTVIPLELFLVELGYKHLPMTESAIPVATGTSAFSSSPFHGNESLSCNTPYHCPPSAHIVSHFKHGVQGRGGGLVDLRSPLCQRAHSLIGMYKMVYFMGCVRILWPLRPGYFKPAVERALSQEEKDFVSHFHRIGFSPMVYPPVNDSESIVHIESFM